MTCHMTHTQDFHWFQTNDCTEIVHTHVWQCFRTIFSQPVQPESCANYPAETTAEVVKKGKNKIVSLISLHKNISVSTNMKFERERK